jgi:hypothetical protein
MEAFSVELIHFRRSSISKGPIAFLLVKGGYGNAVTYGSGHGIDGGLRLLPIRYGYWYDWVTAAVVAIL